MTVKLTDKENKKLVKEMTAHIKDEVDLRDVAKSYGITYARLCQIRGEIRRLINKPFRKTAKAASAAKAAKAVKAAKAPTAPKKAKVTKKTIKKAK